jgi:hypothetical protein
MKQGTNKVTVIVVKVNAISIHANRRDVSKSFYDQTGYRRFARFIQFF